MRIIHIDISRFAVLALAGMPLLLSGCWIKKTTCRGLNKVMGSTCDQYNGDDGGSAEEITTIAGGDQPTGGGVTPTPITEDVTTTVVGQGYALTRVTPEQLGANIRRTLNLHTDFTYDDPYAGQTIDFLQVLFGVPLGGIDFQTATTRDPGTKAQTLLIARVIAWQFAVMGVWTENDLDQADRKVFTKCTLEVDRPYFEPWDSWRNETQIAQIREGEARWALQVEELFYRLYSRPPSATETALIKDAFLAALEHQGYPQAGWITVIYAMLATEEFWHI